MTKVWEESKIIGHSTFARINKHNDADGPFTKTVLIKNTPEAQQAFGVINAPPQNIFKKENPTANLIRDIAHFREY